MCASRFSTRRRGDHSNGDTRPFKPQMTIALTRLRRNRPTTLHSLLTSRIETARRRCWPRSAGSVPGFAISSAMAAMPATSSPTPSAPMAPGPSKSSNDLIRQKGLKLLPRRRVVGRTFAWFGRCCRFAKDCQASIERATAWLFIVNVILLARRLARWRLDQ